MYAWYSMDPLDIFIQHFNPNCLLLKFHFKNPVQDTNILPGFENYKTTTRKNTLKRPRSLSSFFFFYGGYHPVTTERCRSCFSTEQRAANSFWWPLGSFSFMPKGNSTIEVLHYGVMNTSKLVNKKLQLFLGLTENKI